ncbi:MAG: NAD(P)H-dependent oxidoreductase [Acidimicrobiales bacterium]|jgi:NAD(P)H-dependent FMN reductase
MDSIDAMPAEEFESDEMQEEELESDAMQEEELELEIESLKKRVAIVIGSTRPGRISAGIAEWFLDTAQTGSPLRYELVDLAEVNLPFLDEPVMAAQSHYEHEHTRVWSRLIGSYDGFIFVFPQYNWGYPGVLKNALDFLYWEWREKPVSFVTFGTRGGSRAAAQIQVVLQGLHMRELADHLEVRIAEDDVDEQWQLKDIQAILSPYWAQTRAIDEEMVAALTTPGPQVVDVQP